MIKEDAKQIEQDVKIMASQLRANLQELRKTKEGSEAADKIEKLIINNDLNGLKFLYSQYANS